MTELTVFKPENYSEGPWVYKRKKLYYLVCTSAGTKPEMIAYCAAPSATGRRQYQGIIQGNVPNSGTTHPGSVDYKGKSHFFYHNGALPTGGNVWRSTCVAYLHYNPDGTIKPIVQATQAK